MSTSQRGRRPIAAALGLLPLLVAAACGSPAAVGNGPAAPPAATSARTSPDAAAQTRLTAAIRTMQALHSYAFSAVQTVGSQHAAQSLLTGRAVRPSFVSYRLVANGKKTKVALTAVMRKLVILANTLVHEDRLWEPNHA